MNPILLAELIRTLGTVGVPLIVKLMGDIEAKRENTTVTAADLTELARLSALTGAGIFAREGATLPAR